MNTDRLTREQVLAMKPGRSYRLVPRYLPHPGVTRRVEEIRDVYVIVRVNGKEVRLPVRDFARLAVEEVE